jgi:AcrR family transcriptional regulator
LTYSLYVRLILIESQAVRSAPAVGSRVEKAVATRALLLATARRQFAKNGYHATTTPDIVAAAGVTRGALYHHFRDKEDLFEAAFRQVAQELEHAAAASVVELASDPWRQLDEGLQSFLRLIAANSEVQRIVLLDGPVVFGWVKWRELQSEFTFGHLVRALNGLMKAGIASRQPPEPLARLILAALNDAAMSIAHSDHPQRTRVQVARALNSLLQGLRSVK